MATPPDENSSDSGSGSSFAAVPLSMPDLVRSYRLPERGSRVQGVCDRPPAMRTAGPLRLSDPVRALIRSGRTGKQCEPAVPCHFCGKGRGRHLYLFAGSEDGRLSAGYWGACDHLYYSGTPWCDSCFVLAHDAGAVHASCTWCCGVSWGRPLEDSPLTAQLAEWFDEYADEL